MSSSVFDFTIVLFSSALSGMQIILGKAEAHMRGARQSPDGLLEARLQADMLPLAFQIGQVANSSAGALHRVRGEAWTARYLFDNFSAARACIDEAAAYCRSIEPSQLAGREEAEVVWSAPKVELRYSATDYLVTHAIPNFYFHCVTVYSILRGLGVPIGKLNYLGREGSATGKELRGAALAALEAMEGRSNG